MKLYRCCLLQNSAKNANVDHKSACSITMTVLAGSDLEQDKQNCRVALDI